MSRFTLSSRPVLALDLGGTQIRAAVILADGSRISRVSRDTPVAGGPSAVVGACLEAAGEALGRAPDALRTEVVGAGISAPGPVDPWRGVIVEPPNLGPAFHKVPLADELERALGLPAYLDRDTNVAALAEAAYGAARHCPDFLYVTVSTGIGGAIVSEGRLVLGPDGMAGEVGHIPVADGGPRCGCGGDGHLEAVASGRALARDARAAALDGTSPFLAACAAARGAEALTARDVAEGEAAGDPACEAIMSRARHAFAAACAGLTNVFNPTRIVVGGSLAEAQGERLLDAARAEIARAAFHTPARRVRVVPAELGGDVSLAGAHPLVSARHGDPAWRRGRPVQSIHSGV